MILTEYVFSQEALLVVLIMMQVLIVLDMRHCGRSMHWSIGGNISSHMVERAL